MSRLTGAEITIHLLEQQQVRLVAGIPGGAVLPLYDALSGSARIRHVLTRHEQGAGFIAAGLARATGTAGVCIASSGPGLTNLVTVLADAKHDSVPLVAITGQVPRALIGTDAFQEVDAVRIAGPVTKACFRIEAAEQLVDSIPRAFEIALSGRPGPVLVDIPKDVQAESADVPAWPSPGRRAPPPRPDARHLDAAASLIRAAERPILYLGGGVAKAGAERLAVELAERADMPAVMTLMALGTIPHDHRLSLGMLGMHGARATNLALDECDLLVALGARFDDRATGRIADFCPGARIVHADIDAREIGKLKSVDVGLEGDVGATLAGLCERLEPFARPRWRARIDALEAEAEPAPPAAQPTKLIEALGRALAGRAVVTTDVGQHQMWVAQAFPFRRPQELLVSGGLGTMGFGLPAAIGAALAEPDRTVVCVTGDGSLLMNAQELATLAELGLDVKIVVLDNAALGLVHQQQTLFYERRLFASRFENATNFAALAEAHGIEAHDVETPAAAPAAFEQMLARRGPALVRVRLDVEHQVLPMVPPGAANAAMILDDAGRAEHVGPAHARPAS